MDAHLKRKHHAEGSLSIPNATIEAQNQPDKHELDKKTYEKVDDTLKKHDQDEKTDDAPKKDDQNEKTEQKEGEPKIVEDKIKKNTEINNENKKREHQHDQAKDLAQNRVVNHPSVDQHSVIEKTTSSASSSVSSTPRPILNEPIESGSVNYILVDRDQQAKLQMEIKELKEKMNAAEKEFFQLTLMNNNNNEPVSAMVGCETCAKKKQVDLANAAVQCGGNEKDVDTVSEEMEAEDMVIAPGILRSTKPFKALSKSA